MTRSSGLWVVVSLSLGLGCGGDDAPPVGTGASQTADIGTAGGTIELEGTTLDIPAGALSATETIVITSTTDAAPGGFTNLSPIFRFEPDGLVFATAATVTIAFTAGAAGSPALYWSQLDADGFAALSTSIGDGEATAPVTHFSGGFVGIPLPSTIDGGTCGVGETSCGGACVDTTSDPLNCGGCTNACPVVDGGAACISSQCVGGGT